MDKDNSTSTDTISSLSCKTSSNHSVDIKHTKTRIGRRIKKLVFCGLTQDTSPLPLIESTLPTDLNTKSTISMATNNPNQAGWHTVVCGGHEFTLPIRYQNPTPIGEGAFGAVIRATDTIIKKDVAIKKMLEPFKTAIHAQRTYRELKLLIYLNNPDADIVQLYNVFTPETTLNEFKTLYFVFNFAGFNLYDTIKHRKPFPEEYVKTIIYPILRGLKFMHSGGIIHRDLKPQNIGLDDKSNITILDFGLARVGSNGVLTGYVSTRWWRAPEIYLNWERYNEKVDIWSVGCIMAELILLRTVFPGNDHIDQLNRIFEILGTPNLATINEICAPETAPYIRGLTARSRQDLNKLFGYRYGTDPQTPISGVSPQGVDLLGRLLSFDHRARPTAEEALADPFFENLHDPMDEPTIGRMVDEHADANYTVAKWKSIIWQMIQDFVSPEWITNDPAQDA